MAESATFTLTFKTIAELTGLDRLLGGVQNGVRQIESINTGLKSIATAAGAFLATSKLIEYANMATKAREAQAAFAFTILRSKDGSSEYLAELNKFNLELEVTTDTSHRVSEAIEQQFTIFGAGREVMKDLTRLTIDFAKARGMDPGQAGQMLSRAISGEDLMLARFGIHLDKTKQKTEQMRDLIKQLQAMVGGTAKIMADADGGLTQSEFAWDRLKISIGNVVNLVRVPFLLQLEGGLRSAKQTADGLNSSVSTLGQTIFVTSGLIGHWIAENIRLVQITVAAGGAILAYRSSIALFGAGLTRFILPIAAIVTALGYMDKALQETTKNWTGFAIGLPEAVAVMGHAIKIVIETVKAAVPAAVAYVSAKVKETVHDAITELYVLAQAAGAVLQKITGGTVKLEFGDKILEHATAAEEARREAEAAAGQIGKIEGITRKAFTEEFWKAIGNTRDREVGKDDLAEKLKKDFAEITGFLEKMKKDVSKGPGVAPPFDAGAAQKAATEALTAAKYRLAAAEQNYKTALEQTKLLEDAGLISHEQATQSNLQATRDYLAELNRLRDTLPELIRQQEAIGNTKGAAELKLQYGELTTKILETQTSLGNSTFFGQMRQQIRELANEWGNLGKQIGGFLTQQFQAFANTAGQIISNLIFRTGNWKQSILDLGKSFVSQLATMLVQWILTRTVMSWLNRAFGQQEAQGAMQAGATAAAGWAPAATAASIATSGEAAGSGLIAVLIAMAAGVAAIIAMGGFKGGGFTGSGPSSGVAGNVHFNEVVFPEGAVNYWGRDTLVNMALGNLTRPSGYQRGGIGGGTPGLGGSPGGGGGSVVEIHMYNSLEEAIEGHLRSRRSDKHLLAWADRNKVQLGI